MPNFLLDFCSLFALRSSGIKEFGIRYFSLQYLSLQVLNSYTLSNNHCSTFIFFWQFVRPSKDPAECLRNTAMTRDDTTVTSKLDISAWRMSMKMTDANDLASLARELFKAYADILWVEEDKMKGWSFSGDKEVQEVRSDEGDRSVWIKRS